MEREKINSSENKNIVGLWSTNGTVYGFDTAEQVLMKTKGVVADSLLKWKNTPVI